MPEIFHIATADDWAAAQASGEYTTSTRGRTLEQEGFIHASHRDQVQATYRRFYADAGVPLVLLTIDTDRLGVEVREEAPDPRQPGVRFPHVYGPVPVGAVTDVMRLPADGRFPSTLETWLGESFRRMALALMAMLLSYAGYLLAARSLGAVGGALGAVVGLVVGIVVVVLLVRRRGRRT